MNPNLAVNRPNTLWVSDLTFVRTIMSFVYVAFVIDAFARQIVGWPVTTSLRANLVLDRLEQAPNARERTHGSQYLSIRYTERLAPAGVAASVGSRGDSYDNALAETITGLYKTKVIHHEGRWRRE